MAKAMIDDLRKRLERFDDWVMRLPARRFWPLWALAMLVLLVLLVSHLGAAR